MRLVLWRPGHKRSAVWWKPTQKTKFLIVTDQWLLELSVSIAAKKQAICSISALLFQMNSYFQSISLKQKSFCVLFSTAHVKHFKHGPCSNHWMEVFNLQENWTRTTIPQEIDHNSKSIYPTHKIIISPDRGQDGLHSDIKLHAEKCLYQKQLYQNALKTSGVVGGGQWPTSDNCFRGVKV